MIHTDNIITLNNLKVNYGEHEVLKGVNLSICRGDIIGYIGQNGAGKSTTIKVILGLIDDYSGQVDIFGHRLKKGDIEYKRRIGYVPERADMYEQLTPREYLTFIGSLYGIPSHIAEEKAFQLLKLLDMAENFDKRIDSFSKGMRQKVLIVSSLLHNPDIIFLDEPLNGLDTSSVSVIKEIFSALASKGKTIFFSSHIMEVVENLSNRIILLNKGEIVADGDFADLKAKHNKGSLEDVFNQLTGFHQQKNIIDSFVGYVLDELSVQYE